MPIETAPKDETETAILICNGRYARQMRVAYWDNDAARGFNHHKDWPTHWMPLPAEPSIAKP